MDLSGYQLHVFLNYAHKKSDDILDQLNISPDRFCTMVWDARRKRNRNLCHLQDSGNAQGWSAASRAVLVSSFMREKYKCKFRYLSTRNNSIHQEWMDSFMVHAEYSISEYNLRDLELAIRLISRSWLSKQMWKLPPGQTCKLLEILLHDLNLRLEELITLQDDNDVLPSRVIREYVDTTSILHSMLIAYKDRLSNNVPINPETISQWMPKDFNLELRDTSADTISIQDVLSGNTTASKQRDYIPWEDAYRIAKKNIEAHLTHEFIEISRMGRLPENVAKSLRYYLMPLDIYSRYKSIENIDTDSHVVASQRIISNSELNWLEFKLFSLKAEDLLRASKFRPDHAWLFELISIIRLCNLLFCQYNVQFEWIANCFACDRDMPDCSDIDWKRAIQHRPCIVTFGTNLYLVWRENVFTSKSIYEILLLWILIVHSINYKVRVSTHSFFNIQREIELIYDKCFPR